MNVIHNVIAPAGVAGSKKMNRRPVVCMFQRDSRPNAGRKATAFELRANTQTKGTYCHWPPQGNKGIELAAMAFLFLFTLPLSGWPFLSLFLFVGHPDGRE